MPDALVLSGAVAKSAFSAGVLAVLTAPAVKARLGVNITRIVAASSGGLNGVFYAAALQAGQEADAGTRMSKLWVDDATFGKALSVSPSRLLARQGISTNDNLVAWMRANIPPAPTQHAVSLGLIVTNADGETGHIAGSPATTYEHVVRLDQRDFTTRAALENVFQWTSASMAFPGLFAPVSLELHGRTIRGIDGGLTDNTPLGHALREAPEITRVFVISPFPRVRTQPANMQGFALLSHVFDLLIEERLFRDLRNAAHVNRALAELQQCVPDEAQRAAVLRTLGWQKRRPVQIVEIRPPEELPGDAFSGFVNRALRQQYVDAGTRAARQVVSSLGG